MLSRCLPIAVLAGLLAGGMSPALAQLRLPSGWQIELGASAHVAGYSGDIGHKGQYGVLSDTQWNLVQMGGGLSLRGQQKGQRLGWNLDVRRIRIQGADSMSNNAVAFVRNLHFRNEMTEVALTADLPLLRLGGICWQLAFCQSLIERRDPTSKPKRQSCEGHKILPLCN